MQIEKRHFPIRQDSECECGMLIALEEMAEIPFSLKRVYYIYGVSGDVSRGAHAHRDSNQLLISLRGSCEIVLDDGDTREKVLLDRPDEGVLQSKMVWGEMHHFSPDALLMVLTDTLYDPNDYIHDYETFLALAKARHAD